MAGRYLDVVEDKARFLAGVPIMLSPADPVAGLRSLLTNVRLIPGAPITL